MIRLVLLSFGAAFLFASGAHAHGYHASTLDHQKIVMRERGRADERRELHGGPCS